MRVCYSYVLLLGLKLLINYPYPYLRTQILLVHIAPSTSQGDVWICMELLDASMDKISKRVDVLKQTIPEEIIGKMTVAVIKALHYLKEELLIIHRGTLSHTICCELQFWNEL